MGFTDKQKEFKALYQQYYAPYCLFARHFVDDPAVCEDLVSDVFVNLWKKVDAMSLIPATIPAYIKMCVRNACLNYLKHSAFTEGLVQESHFAEHLYEENPDGIYTIEELYAMLYEILETLPQAQREVFVKSYVEGKKREEIAAELNLSVKTVGRYKQKTLELLRVHLKDYLPVILALLQLGICKN